jgi:hypothetical protein
MYSLSQWSFTKQTKNKTHIYQMASFFRWNPKGQHKDHKNPHIIKHIWHTDKTAGDIKIHRFAQIPHGMVEITHNIRLRGSVYGIHMGPTKGIQMIPHGRNLSMSSYGQ